ncbi:MAG: N,N-dimethylformamidase beta subunit family domain-containing protein, partial [Rhodospirillales bacterium]
GAGADMLARWDFSQDMTTVKAVDVSGGGNHGHFVNAPARAMKGAHWDGAFHRWTERPDHYGAVHFHHDDLYDAKWEKAFSWAVPEGFASGAYAMQIICGENTRDATLEYHIPFFVRPPRRPAGTAGTRNRIAFLAPTASYMAYANHAEHITAREAERVIGRLLQFGHADMYMYDHPEIGLSLYDSHLDGSGVCYSSRLRPVLNFTSQYHSWLGGHGSALWQYNADTHLLAWLEHKGFEFDVITDEDLHEEGAHLLEDYRVVLTGTHPEYYSEKMWNGLKSWIDAGGRLMYLGANGFYWHIAFSDDMPGLMEVRRAEDGIRTWAAEPGEYYHSFNGAMGGLYRRRGHPPNEMGGVGFIAQGFDLSSYYRRAPGADDPRVRFIFEGVDDEIIGDFGLIGGGAAGLELDCITKELGSPPNIIKLASSENHTSLVMLVNEEFGVVPPNLGGDQNDKVRADLAFFETPAGGAVFATGSIAWCGALPVNRSAAVCGPKAV